jgi:hypothetical protein
MSQIRKTTAGKRPIAKLASQTIIIPDPRSLWNPLEACGIEKPWSDRLGRFSHFKVVFV